MLFIPDIKEKGYNLKLILIINTEKKLKPKVEVTLQVQLELINEIDKFAVVAIKNKKII